MAKIIERVPSKLNEWEEEHVRCNKCGYGNTKDLTEKPCPNPNCDGHWEREIVKCSSISPSYILVECDCGEEIVCSGFTNSCICGADYNWAGQRLASRSQWGEETGETLADIFGPEPEKWQ